MEKQVTDTARLVWYNGSIMPETDVELSMLNRAFCYGDSLFETIIAIQSRIPHWLRHWERLSGGMAALGYASPKGFAWSPDTVLEQIHSLIQAQGTAAKHSRIKMQVWREQGGKYTPLSQQFHCLITAQPTKLSPPRSLTAGISKQVHLQATPWSAFKTGNALPYIQAGRERIAKGWDEIILLNARKQVAEAGASNLFWIKNSIIYTPCSTTGCLEGVSRAFIVEFFKKNAKMLSIGAFNLSDLLQADHIFTSNVAGLHHITKLHHQSFEPWEELDHLGSALYA